MQLNRYLVTLILTAFLLSKGKDLNAQCATGTLTITSVSSTGGAGTYSNPATGIILINYCFSLKIFTEINTNWVHGIFVSWDNLPKGATIIKGPTGTQATQHGNRFWVFLDSTAASNSGMPGPGFFVDDGDFLPKNNYGDNGSGTPKATFPDLANFCFTIRIDCSIASPMAYVPKVTVTGDGTTGGWSNPACPGDVIRVITGGPNGNGAVVVCGIVLPVKLLEFSGESVRQGNLLKWTAVADNLFSHFEVEASKDNTGNFFAIDKIDGSTGGSGNQIREYQFLDDQPAAISLYRLRMVEKDGSFVYSKIISVKQKNNFISDKFSLLPNPANDFILVHNETDSHFGEIEIHVFDLYGQLIHKSKFISDKTEKDFFIETSNFATGMYFMEITSGNQSLEKLNFIKQ